MRPFQRYIRKHLSNCKYRLSMPSFLSAPEIGQREQEVKDQSNWLLNSVMHDKLKGIEEKKMGSGRILPPNTSTSWSHKFITFCVNFWPEMLPRDPQVVQQPTYKAEKKRQSTANISNHWQCATQRTFLGVNEMLSGQWKGKLRRFPLKS